MPDEDLKNLKKLMNALKSDNLGQEEFMGAFKAAMDKINELHDTNKQDLLAAAQHLAQSFTEMRDQTAQGQNQYHQNLSTNVETRLNKAISDFTSVLNEALDEQQVGMNYLYDKVTKLQDGEDGEDGKDGSPDTPIDVRNKLETLQGDERLDKSAIKGIDQIEGRIKSLSLRPASIGGAKGIGLYIGGSKKLLTAQTLNLVAGSGITLSYAYAGGRNDITISASGSVALTPITITGTKDDNNKSFTAASAPTLVIVNGAAYRNGAGVTISGTTITLDNPVGTGGDLYGL